MEGIISSRCVSLASSGFPVAVCAPLTTQLLLPSPARIPLLDAARNSTTDCANSVVMSGALFFDA